jgi:hypothetical protein
MVTRRERGERLGCVGSAAAPCGTTCSPNKYPALAALVRFLPSEPILFPKLRIEFADFPYLHCSIDSRLFTLET